MVAHSSQLSQSGGNGQSGNHNMYGEPPPLLTPLHSIGEHWGLCIAFKGGGSDFGGTRPDTDWWVLDEQGSLN